MTHYGFRLHEVHVRQGRGQTDVALDKCGGEHYADVLARLLHNLASRATIVGYPEVADGDDAAPADGPAEDEKKHQNKPALQVEDVKRIGNLVEAKVYYGRYGSFRRGLHPAGQQPTDLTDIAPTHEYRVFFNLPAKGETGLVMMEDISRSHPQQMLRRWLRYAAQEDAAQKAIAAHRAEGREPAGEASAAAAAPWWAVRFSPAADPTTYLAPRRSRPRARLQPALPRPSPTPGAIGAAPCSDSPGITVQRARVPSPPESPHRWRGRPMTGSQPGFADALTPANDRPSP